MTQVTRSCGSCTLCCKVFDINQPDQFLVKSADKWCAHCDVGHGCRIYTARPPVCEEFTCFWLAAPENMRDMFPDSMRPDLSGVVFQHTGQPIGITCTISMPGKDKQKQVLRLIAAVVSSLQKLMVVFHAGQVSHVYFIERGALVIMTKSDYARHARTRKDLPTLVEPGSPKK